MNTTWNNVFEERMMERRYKIKLPMGPPEFKEEGFTVEELGENICGCDAFLYFSILGVDGWMSLQVVGRDGRKPGGPDIQDSEIFKVWLLMAQMLSESKTLGDGRKKLPGAVLEIVREILKQGHDGANEN